MINTFKSICGHWSGRYFSLTEERTCIKNLSTSRKDGCKFTLEVVTRSYILYLFGQKNVIFIREKLGNLILKVRSLATMRFTVVAYVKAKSKQTTNKQLSSFVADFRMVVFRIDWMMSFQGMVVLAGNQVWWTWEVEDVFRKVKKGDKMAMKNYAKKMHKQISDLVQKVCPHYNNALNHIKQLD